MHSSCPATASQIRSDHFLHGQEFPQPTSQEGYFPGRLSGLCQRPSRVPYAWELRIHLSSDPPNLDIHWSVTVVPQNIVVHSYPWVKQGSDIAVAKAVAAFALGCRSGFVDFAAVVNSGSGQ